MFKLPSMGSAALLSAAAEKFVWSESIGKLAATALLSMVPMYEGRYAVPAMVALGLPPLASWLLAGVASTEIGRAHV